MEYLRFPPYTGPGAIKDKEGRILGGGRPIVNYAPTMVTGRACPRVTEWKVEVVELGEGFRLANVDNPCVVQNAIDDYVEIAWALPMNVDYGQMLDLLPRYETDLAFKDRFLKTIFVDKFVKDASFRKGFAYGVCNPRLVEFINPESKTQVDWQTGTVMYLDVFHIAPGFAKSECTIATMSYPQTVTKSIIDPEKAIYRGKVWMWWNKDAKRWTYGQYGPGGQYRIDQILRWYNPVRARLERGS